MGAPAYTRLENDERRRRLLELGARLFTEHAYDEISMAQIAREAGISKALLYHYFPSKQEYFMATLAGGAEELRARVEPDPALPPAAGADGRARRVPAMDRGQRRRLREALSQRRGRARGARARRRRARRRRPTASSTASARRTTRGRAPRCAGGCGSWTGRAWTGSPTATLTRAEMHGLLLGTLAGALMAAGVSFPTA